MLLDISRSMQVDDVSPSRLGRAKQEIQDLIVLNRAVRIGLIAFASVPHVIAPITEDTATSSTPCRPSRLSWYGSRAAACWAPWTGPRSCWTACGRRAPRPSC